MRKRSEIGKKITEGVEQVRQERAAAAAGQVECAKCHLVQPGGTSDCLSCGETLPKFIVNAGEPPKREVPPMENLGALAYALKEKDLDITLAQLCAVEPEERRELQKWVDAKSADVTPRVRMILEHLRTVQAKPLAGPGARDENAASDEIFKTDPQPVADSGMRSRLAVGVDVGKDGGTTSVLVEKDDAGKMKVLDIKHTPPPQTVAREVIQRMADADVGEEVTYVLGKEMYRVTEFCTFDVGPYSATTRVRENETRIDAINRLREELEMAAEIDRVKRRDSYIRTYLGIKPVFEKAVQEKKNQGA